MKINKTITDCTLIKRVASLKAVNLDGNTGMLNIETGKYTMLNTVGTLIWNYSEKPIPVKDIVDRLINEFDISYEECKKSVVLYLDNLLNEKLIDVENL